MDINKMIKDKLREYVDTQPTIEDATIAQIIAQIEHVPVTLADKVDVNCIKTVSGVMPPSSTIEPLYTYTNQKVSMYKEKTIFDIIEEHVENMDTDEKINFIQTILDRIDMTDAFIDYMRKEGMI